MRDGQISPCFKSIRSSQFWRKKSTALFTKNKWPNSRILGSSKNDLRVSSARRCLAWVPLSLNQTFKKTHPKLVKHHDFLTSGCFIIQNFMKSVNLWITISYWLYHPYIDPCVWNKSTKHQLDVNNSGSLGSAPAGIFNGLQLFMQLSQLFLQRCCLRISHPKNAIQHPQTTQIEGGSEAL